MFDPIEDSLLCPFVAETFLPLKYLVEVVDAFDPFVVDVNFAAFVATFEYLVVEEFVVVLDKSVVGFVFAEC